MDEFLIAPGYVSWLDPGLSIFKTEFDSAHYNSRLMAEIGPAYGALIDKAIVKRKSEFIAGRYCAHRSIAAWNPTSDLIGIGKGSMPLWPSKVIGSISHCQGYAIAATAATDDFRAIGIDVEEIVTSEIINNIERLVVNEDESILVGRCEARQRDRGIVFTLIFSAKESFFKAAYPYARRYFGFEAISAVHIDWVKQVIYLKINGDIGNYFSCGTVIPAYFKQIDRRILTLLWIRRSDAGFSHLDSCLEGF
ncbi:4'-phosphopantetheinyl transferase family protein [Xanthomonas arboricola]|uniref:4'-phosphopantetheinyl transferase family protein n=1 Tax=Xanthomonas arboricola TaxID=56448 RepID=UPI0009D6D5F0|nr:4'-phosphopantetheinyl transferase superfamily protein [Xanthomonas arboricola]